MGNVVGRREVLSRAKGIASEFGYVACLRGRKLWSFSATFPSIRSNELTKRLLDIE